MADPGAASQPAREWDDRPIQPALVAAARNTMTD